MGCKFEQYADSVLENQVDGAFLHSLMQDDDEGDGGVGGIEETLDDLGISNRLHRRVLMKKLKDISEQQQQQQQQQQSQQMEQQQPEQQLDETMLFQAFDDITQEALDKTESAIYAGLHLLKDNGYLVLSGKFRNQTKHLKRFILEQNSPSHDAFQRFCRERTEDYLEEPLLFDGMTDEESIIDPTMQPKVAVHVLKDDRNNRVGAICILKLVDTLVEQQQEEQKAVTNAKESTDSSKDLLLKALAAEAERQMQERKAILERTASLEYQLQLKQDASSIGGIERSMKYHIMKCIKEKRQASSAKTRQVSIRLTDQSLLSADETNETCPQKRSAVYVSEEKVIEKKKPKVDGNKLLDTASEELYQVDRATTEEDTRHLPCTFYEKIDAAGGPRPPVREGDMVIQAVVDDMDFGSITPDSDIGKRIKKIVQLVASLFDFSMGMMVFSDQYFANSIAVVATTQKAKDLFNNGFQVVTRDVDDDDLPFFSKNDRACSMCNYPMFSGTTLIVPDAANDRTFQWLYQAAGIRSYIGSPCVGTLQ